jgi:type I site-specific restriction-modification system R (restriction) subunit
MRDAVPNASFFGFTGTPIERTDANLRRVFGDYISIYDIQQAVEDGATVKIYCEGDDKQGALKIVMTGSAADPLGWQQHLRSKARREDLALRFKGPNDPYKYGYPPDKQEKATDTVLEQAEWIAKDWAG